MGGFDFAHGLSLYGAFRDETNVFVEIDTLAVRRAVYYGAVSYLLGLFLVIIF